MKKEEQDKDFLNHQGKNSKALEWIWKEGEDLPGPQSKVSKIDVPEEFI